MLRIGSTLLIIWFAIGAIAAWQRDYFKDAPESCAKAGTITVTVLAGPLNYVGANPKVKDCPSTPEPSK